MSYHFFSNFEGCILEELHVSFNNMLGMVFKVHRNEVKWNSIKVDGSK